MPIFSIVYPCTLSMPIIYTIVISLSIVIDGSFGQDVSIGVWQVKVVGYGQG